MSKTALITGGAGFIGHHLVQHIFQNTDWNVVVLDRLDISGDLNRLGEILEGHPEYKSRLKFVFHDLKAEINPHVSAEIGKPNLVFHLAASSHVERSIQDPLSFFMDNTIGTVNLLNWCRGKDNIDYIQSFSTDEVYGNALGGISYKEEDRYKPRNPYAASKAAADHVAYSFFITYGLPLVITNCMNVIGERQVEKFVPLVIKKILNGETIQIHSYPGAQKAGTRNYIHARNVAAACLFLVNEATFGESYNFEGQEEIDNLEMAKRIASYMDYNNGGGRCNFVYNMVDFHSARPGHDLRYALDGSKLRSMGFTYPVEFEESLERTVKWTLNNKRWLS